MNCISVKIGGPGGIRTPESKEPGLQPGAFDRFATDPLFVWYHFL